MAGNLTCEEALSSIRVLFPALKLKYGVKRIGIFGSCARNECGPDSDIDIVIEMEKPDLFNLVHIREDIKNTLHRNIDLVRYRHNMNPFLKNRIDRDARYA